MLRKSDVFLLSYIDSISLFSLWLQINDKQNTTFKFSVKLFSNKMHGATFKLVLNQRRYMLIAHTELLLQIIEG